MNVRGGEPTCGWHAVSPLNVEEGREACSRQQFFKEALSKGSGISSFRPLWEADNPQIIRPIAVLGILRTAFPGPLLWPSMYADLRCGLALYLRSPTPLLHLRNVAAKGVKVPADEIHVRLQVVYLIHQCSLA